jgi:hypothetical protein
MATVDVNQLVPITRESLRQYYETYPADPPSAELQTLRTELQTAAHKLGLKLPEKWNHEGESHQDVPLDDDLNKAILGEYLLTIPHKMDENIWRSRQQLEEIVHLVEPSELEKVEGEVKGASGVSLEEWKSTVESIRSKASSAFDRLQEFQKGGMQKVQHIISTFLPNDFRMSIVKAQQERSEAKREEMVNALIASGGSIKDKYDLYWKLQLERRQTLVHIGNASGAYKAIIKYVGGVPQVLLDFIKTVNDTTGPMEELRIRFGPKSYFLTEFINASFLYLAALFYIITSDHEKKAELLGSNGQQGTLVQELRFVAKLITAYEQEEGAYLEQQFKILQNSPFFVTKDQVGGLNGPGEEKEVLVAKVHEERIKVDAGDEVVWEWLTKNKDIEFYVAFIKEGTTNEQLVKAKERYESHVNKVTGSHGCGVAGTYKLVWDNSYSWLTKKQLVYKVYKKSDSSVDEKAIEETMHEIEEDEKAIEKEVMGN